MDFFNETLFPATFFRTGLLYKDLIMATTVVKCSFEVTNEGVFPVADQLAIVENDIDTDFGHLDSDISLIKKGCDFAVMGNAMAGPNGAKTKRMVVEISLHDVHHRLLVIGDRYWTRHLTGFRPSQPVPFSQMPLNYQYAYGGQTRFFDSNMDAEVDIVSPSNPHGKGYVEQRKYVEKTPLPNIEDPDNQIAAWTDRPDPVGCAPLPRSLSIRGLRGIHANLNEEKTTLSPEAFLFCHPKMHLETYPGGDQLTVRGMTDQGIWTVTLPQISFVLSVELGKKRYMVPVVPDTLVALPSYNRFFVVARQAVVYQFIPKRIRKATLLVSDPDSNYKGTETIAGERVADCPAISIEPENPQMMPLPFDVMLEHYPLTKIIESLPLLVSG